MFMGCQCSHQEIIEISGEYSKTAFLCQFLILLKGHLTEAFGRNQRFDEPRKMKISASLQGPPDRNSLDFVI
jgi:hypothetical protein